MKRVLFGFSLLILVVSLAACSSQSPGAKNNGALSAGADVQSQTPLVSKQPAEKVQIFLFHATRRCTTCMAIGRLAGETVDEYFQPERQAGRVEFREINIDLPENKELAKKFQASGSSLFINAVYNGRDNISEDIMVWRLTTNETQFKNYLKNKISNFLGK